MTIISNYNSQTGNTVKLDFHIKSMLFEVTKYHGTVVNRLFTNQKDAESQLDEWVKE